MFVRLNLPNRQSFFGAVLCAIGLLVVPVGEADGQTKSVATSMRGFGVPFRVNANDDSFLEVQLYVSNDLGKTWQFHSRQSTDVEEFPFFADQDGTYWFALKTLNRDRRLIPDGNIVKPELEIVVDTKKPELDFRIETDAAGRVACRWRATDENIRPDSLQILYQSGQTNQVNENAWQAVDVKLAPAKVPATGIYADQIAWWPEPDLRQITVRLKVEDTAGNSAIEDRHVVLPLVAWRSKSSSTARPPGRSVNANAMPLSQQNVRPETRPETKGASPHTHTHAHPAKHPAGVVCENGVCRIVKNTGPPIVPSDPIGPRGGHLNERLPFPKTARAGELYGMSVPKPQRPVSVGAKSHQSREPAKVRGNEREQDRRSSVAGVRPTRTAQTSQPQTRSPALNLVGSEAQPVAPPVPDGYVHVAAKPVAQQSQPGRSVTWQSEPYRWSPRNQSAFASTLKPDPSLVPKAQSSRSAVDRPQVPANPSIQFQKVDQQIAQSSTNFPRNQYQGIAPTVPSDAITRRPPALMPQVRTNEQVAGVGRQRLAKPPTQPPTNRSIGSNSLGPLQNYSETDSSAANTGRSIYQPSAYAQRSNGVESQSRVPAKSVSSPGRASVGRGQAEAGMQMISSKRFRLDYAINAIDPSGVAKVDLWMTRDNGLNWQLWGSDPDSVSPFPVQVNDEGRYGFRIVIQSRDGLTGQGPSRGDQPDMYVHVDSQPPLAKITSVPYGRGNEAGRLVINWSVSDPFLSLRPVRLSYSRSPAGPWTIIDNGLRNVGRYVWKVEPNVPERIFLKIEATDQAGNVGVHQLSQAIDISGLVPRGTIRGVVPVGR